MNELYLFPKDRCRNFIVDADQNLLCIHAEHDGADYFVVNKTGEIGATLPGVAKICEVSIEEIKDLIATSQECPPSVLLEIFKGGRWAIMLYNHELVYSDAAISSLLAYYAYEKFNPVAIQRFTNLFSPSRAMTIDEAISLAVELKYDSHQKTKEREIRKKVRAVKVRKGKFSKERRIQLRLKAELNGQIEVRTPAGNIDLLTETEIIEIKVGDEWKYGLGQLLAYAIYHEDKNKRLHLFGKVSNFSDIKYACALLGVEVTIEEVDQNEDDFVL